LEQAEQVSASQPATDKKCVKECSSPFLKANYKKTSCALRNQGNQQQKRLNAVSPRYFKKPIWMRSAAPGQECRSMKIRCDPKGKRILLFISKSGILRDAIQGIQAKKMEESNWILHHDNVPAHTSLYRQ
jgi:hypothetical protein